MVESSLPMAQLLLEPPQQTSAKLVSSIDGMPVVMVFAHTRKWIKKCSIELGNSLAYNIVVSSLGTLVLLFHSKYGRTQNTEGSTWC